MKQLNWLFGFCLCFLIIPSQQKIYIDLVEKYLISERNVRSAVMILCSERDTAILGRKLNNANIYVTNYFIGKDDLNVTKLLPYLFHSTCGIVVDCECSGVEGVLQDSSDIRYFNLTYTWMLFGAPGDNWESYLDPFFNIEYSSDLIFVQRDQDNSSVLKLIDVYSLGRHRGSSLIGVPFAEYEPDRKYLRILINLWPKFRTQNRGNFKGFKLKSVALIDRDNVTDEDVMPFMLYPGKTIGIANFVKFQAYLHFYILEMHNISVYYCITRAWAGHSPSGLKLGVVGVMDRQEADMAMAAILYMRDRYDSLDYIHTCNYFQCGFVFRVNSDSGSAGASLMTPLNWDVWISLILTILIILLVGVIVRGIRMYNKLPYAGSTARDTVDILAAMCQQGIDPIPSNIVEKIIILMTLIMAFFIYNYYTSSVVGVLLSTPVKGPLTPEEILESSYKVSFDDTAYHRVLFMENKSAIVVNMYEKKLVGPKRGPKDLPMYAGLFDAIPHIKSGEWAYHGDLNEAYSLMPRYLDAYEVCNLRGIIGINPTGYEYAVLPKLSQYKDLMKIALMRLHEVGFVQRGLKMYRKEKPDCLAGISVFAVAFKAVESAFYVLIAGICLSLFVLVVEIFWRWYSLRKVTQLMHSREHLIGAAFK